MSKDNVKKYLNYLVECTDAKYTLEETDSNAKLKKVVINGIPQGALIVRIDNGDGINKLLKSDGDDFPINKRSDYLIIDEKNVIFVEMKSKNVDKKDCILKFKSSACLISYIDNLFNEFLGSNSYFENKAKHYVVISLQISCYKDPFTENYNTKSNTRPGQFRNIETLNGGEVFYQQFL
jgi:hypothetical protein